MSIVPQATRVQTVVIGGGQAGLSVGYHLARRRLPFVILEADEHVGDIWRRRWDSLRLFTPARYDGLDGWPFPGRPDAFPTKNEMADYLDAYARHFQLPVRTGTRVTRLTRTNAEYRVDTASGAFVADHVVVAMSNYQAPRVPQFASALDPAIVQLHSRDYKNGSAFREGGVLVVGAGNSGAEIAAEAARGRHETWLSGRDTGHIPFRVDSFLGRRLLVGLVFRLLFHRILTVNTSVGRRVRAKVLSMGAPLIRTRPRELAAAGVERVPRVTGTRNGLPVLADGRVLEAANVVWCTGYDPGFSWIDLPVLEPSGEPRHQHGFAAGEPGLYFVGLHFVYAFSSAMIHGVGRDADRIAGVIARRVAAARSSAAAA